MSGEKTKLAYYLPRSCLRITGEATSTYNLATGKRDYQAEAEIELVARADPQAAFLVRLDKSKVRDTELSIEWSGDGLLVSTASKATGKAGSILKSVVGLATTVFGVVTGMAPVAVLGAAAFGAGKSEVEAEAEEEEPEVAPSVLSSILEAEYAKEHPGLAKRREAIREALEKVSTKLIELESSLVAEEDAANRQKIAGHVTDLKAGLETLRAEAKIVDDHFDAWRTRKEDKRTERVDYTVPVRDLPTVKTVEENASASESELEEALGSSYRVYALLGIVIARPDDSYAAPEHDVPGDKVGEAFPGFFYRRVMPIDLSLYRRGGGGELKQIRKEAHSVIDESYLGFVELGKSDWAKETVDVTFAEDGSLKKLANTRGAELAAALEAAGELPAEVKGALQQASEIVDEVQKLALQRIDHRISVLEKQKSQVQREIELNTAVDTRAMTEELAELKAEIEVLKARKDLSAAQRALDIEDRTQMIQLETEVLALRTALEQAQVDRLEVQAELRKLQENDAAEAPEE